MLSALTQAHIRSLVSAVRYVPSSFLLAVLAGPAPAADPLQTIAYPDRPIRLVVPYPSEGVADTLGTLLARHFEMAFNIRVFIENRPGQGGNVGAAVVARAAPDGYTLLVGAVATHVENPALYGDRMPFQGVDDFAPIALLAQVPVVLAVRTSLPVQSVKELIALAKEGPQPLKFASPAGGAIGAIGRALFSRGAGVDFLNVPYPGSVAAAYALASGAVDVTLISGTRALDSYVRTERVRIIGVAARERSKLLPDVPLVTDTIADFSLIGAFGLFAPKGTHREIVQRLHRSARAALVAPAAAKQLAEHGIEPATGSTADFELLLRQELVTRTKLILDAGIQPE